MLNTIRTFDVIPAVTLLALLFVGAIFTGRSQAAEPAPHQYARSTQISEASLQSVYRGITKLGRNEGLCDVAGDKQALAQRAIGDHPSREVMQPDQWMSAKAACKQLMNIRKDR